MTVREEILEQIIEIMRVVEDQGRDGLIAARAALPGTPESVLAQAWWELEERKTEGWWKSIEKTIDGEIIRRALGDKSGGAE